MNSDNPNLPTNKPTSWDDFYELLGAMEIPEDYMADREQQDPPERDLF